MQKTCLKAGDLIGYRLRTLDEGAAALRDLVVDASAWCVTWRRGRMPGRLLTRWSWSRER